MPADRETTTAAARIRGIRASFPANSQGVALWMRPSGPMTKMLMTPAGHAYDGHQVKFPGDDQGTDTIDKGEGKGDDEGPYRADMPEIFSFRAFQGIGGPRAAIVQNQHREEDVDENPQQGGL